MSTHVGVIFSPERRTTPRCREIFTTTHRQRKKSIIYLVASLSLSLVPLALFLFSINKNMQQTLASHRHNTSLSSSSHFYHVDRRRRRSVIRLLSPHQQRRTKLLSSFVLQRVAPSWRTIVILVVLFLGNNDHQHGAPSISYVRANKGYQRAAVGIATTTTTTTTTPSAAAATLSTASSSSASVMMEQYPLLPPTSSSFLDKSRWKSISTTSMAASSVDAASTNGIRMAQDEEEYDDDDDINAPMNLTELVARVCPRGGAGGGDGTIVHRHHHHRHHNQKSDNFVTTHNVMDSTLSTSTSTSNIPINNNNNKYTFSLYQPGDLSDVHPHGIPDRYMRMQNYNVDKARKALANSLQFRVEHQVDTLLGRPHVKFDQCKAVFPHYLLGWATTTTPLNNEKKNQNAKEDGINEEEDHTSSNKHVIFLQRPALVQLSLAQQLNVTIDDLLMHYVYVFEYIWNILNANHSNATMVSLIDLTGLDMSLLRKPELLKLVQRFISMIDAQYPQRAHITMLLNAPKWFGGLYRIISPILRESTKAKIKILSNGQEQEDLLIQYLGKDVVQNVLPPELRKRSRHHKKRKKHPQQQQQQQQMQQPQQQQPQQHHRRRRGWRNKNHHEEKLLSESEGNTPTTTTTEIDVIIPAAVTTTVATTDTAADDGTTTPSTMAVGDDDSSHHHHHRQVAEFGGQFSPMEVELRNFCLERLQEAGTEMMPL